MIVRCVSRLGASLSQETIDAGELRTSVYELKVGDHYAVYGIMLQKGCLSYLTMMHDWPDPGWHPAELFEVVDGRQPPNWYFRFYGYDNYVIDAIWGYKELLDDEHCQNISLRVESDLALFHRRKEEIDAAMLGASP